MLRILMLVPQSHFPVKIKNCSGPLFTVLEKSLRKVQRKDSMCCSPNKEIKQLTYLPS
jgi:hypothetical protein